MKNRFNLSHYKELLEIKESGKYDLVDQNFLKLLSYQASIVTQIQSNRKEDYFSLIEKYLNGVITPYEFRAKIVEIENEDSETAYRILEDFEELEFFRLGVSIIHVN